MSHKTSLDKARPGAYTIFFLAASFYLYEYVLQVAPSVMAEPMMRTFHVTAQGFGIISAFYFYSYAPMQLPAGVLFDRYGPRKLMTAALVLCAFGSFFFAATDHLFTAALGRFFIGVGSAFSFVGLLILLSRWFPPYYFAILAGVAQAMSSVGAIFGEMPLAALVGAVGWRYASFILFFIGLILALLMWVVVRDHPVKPKKSTTRPRIVEEFQRLVKVCSLWRTWVIGMYAFAIWTPIAVFGSLWGVPYLQQKYGISVIHASSMCTMIWLGIGFGSPILGWLSDLLRTRRLALILSAAFGLVATWFVLYADSVSMATMYVALFFYGFGAGGQTVSFAVINDTIEDELLGTASGFNNLSVLIGGAIFQPLVGVFLDKVGHFQMVGTKIIYPILSYQKALIVLPLCFAMALIVAVFLLKETHPSRGK